MKKLIMMTAVICAAYLSHGAACSWALSGVTSSPDNTAAAGWVAYFMDGSTYSTFSALTADKVGDYAAANYTYTTTTISGRTGVSAGATSGTYSAGDSVSAYVVLFDASKVADAKNYAVTSVLTQPVPASGNLQMAWAFSSDTAGWQTTAVPEPTSGLLMLLGMAGLALRRRRA